MENESMDLIEMKNISVEFPGVRALSNVDFTIKSGHVTALVGANGAGKSSLMKVLAGVYSHYTGDIFINGNHKEIRSPKEAIKNGIAIVYQEVDTVLISDLSVGENIMLEYLVSAMGKKQFINWGYVHSEAKKVLDKFNMNIPTRRLVSSLSLAEKQMVVIARAVVENCKYLILDEPTAPLSAAETDKLFEIVRDLKSKGVGVIFISHRLNELFQICESVTVMRDSKVITSFDITKDTTIKQIVELMLGRSFDEIFDKKPAEISDVLLEVKDLTEKEGLVKDINMYVRKGEIVGISGLVGAGKTELCKTLFGAYKHSKGSVVLNGKPVSLRNPHKAVQQGFAFIPEERRKEGMLIEEPIYINMSLATLDKFCKLSFINKAKEMKNAELRIKELGIKAQSPRQKSSLLSGGNQQKITIGKWLNSDAEVFILDEVTKGIDIAAKHDVFNLVTELARAGKGVIFSSCEQSEILALTDRVYVMYDGMIQKEFVTKDTTEEELLFYSTGGKVS